MTPRRASTAVILGSVAYLVVAGMLHEGLKGQPHVVLAGSVDDFAAELRAAGGPGAIRSGIVLDMVFIGAFAGAALVLLRSAGLARWQLLPVAYALVDTAENALTWYLVDTDPDAGMVRALSATGVLKFVLFGGTSIAIIAAWRRVDPRARRS